MANRYWVGGTGTWNTSSTTNWSAASALSFTASCFGTTLTTVGSPALIVGMQVYLATNATTLGTITGGSGNSWTVSTGGTAASQTMKAATRGASVPTSADSVFFDTNSSGTTAYTVTMTGALACLDFNGTALTPTFATGTTPTLSVAGSFAVNTGSTWSSTGAITFTATTTGKTITTNGVSISTSATLDGVSGAWTLGSALTITGTFTLTNGTIDLNGNTLTCGLFSSNNSNTRTLAFGTGNITVNGTGTVWTTATVTGLTVTGTPTVNVSNNTATATTVSPGALSEANSISFNFTTGTYSLNFLNTAGYTARDVNFTGFAGTLAATSTAIIYGSLTLSSGMTTTSSNSALTFGATSGTKTITSNGNTLNSLVTFDGVGGTWQLQDALTIRSSGTLTQTNGTFDLNGKTATVGNYFLGAGTKNLTFNGGTLTVTQAGGAFNVSTNPTGWTNTAGSAPGYISMTSASAKQLSYTNQTFNCTIQQAGAGVLSMTTTTGGTGTFFGISNTVQPTTITFTSSFTTIFTNWNVSGTAGNLVTINSSTVGTRATISKSSGTVSSDYLSVRDSAATGGATWYAGANSTNVSNNTGWIFTAPSSGNFFSFLTN